MSGPQLATGAVSDEVEPQRIAAAVEAARTPVLNYIEQSGKR